MVERGRLCLYKKGGILEELKVRLALSFMEGPSVEPNAPVT
jgi:hypothetical protein